MQINLLSLLGGGADNTGEAGKSSNPLTLVANSLRKNGAVLSSDGAQQAATQPFDQLFEGKLTQLLPENLAPALAANNPKLMAALLQRLHLILPETEAMNPVLPELSQDQIAAMAEVMGVDSAALVSNAAESAGQIFPQGEGLQDENISALMSALRELAQLGQQLHEQGMVLVAAQSVAGGDSVGSAEVADLSVLEMMASPETPADMPVQEVTLSDETVDFLSKFFGVDVQEIRDNINRLKLIPASSAKAMAEGLGHEAKAPGLLHLLARVLNKPVQEVWKQLDDLTDGEIDLPFGLVVAELVRTPLQDQPEKILSFDHDMLQAPKQSALDDHDDLPVGKLEGALPDAAKQNAQSSFADPSLQVQDALTNSAATPFSALQSVAEIAGREIISPDMPVEETAAMTPLVSAAVAKPASQRAKPIDPFALSPEELAELKRPLPEVVSEKASSRVNSPLPTVNAEASASQRRQIGLEVAREMAVRPDVAFRNPVLPPAALIDTDEDTLSVGRSSMEAGSSLSLTAADSRLDFDSRLRDLRGVQQRAAYNPASIRDQITVQVQKAIDSGDTHIRVSLRPAELGRVEVRMEVNHDGRTAIHIVAENRDTLALLQRDSRALVKAFDDLGMELADSGMSFNLQDHSAGGYSQQENAGGDVAAGRNAARQSFEAMLNQDEIMAQALLDSPHLNYVVGADDGLNIKV